MTQSMQGLLNVEPKSKHTIKLSILWAGILSALQQWPVRIWFPAKYLGYLLKADWSEKIF